MMLLGVVKQIIRWAGPLFTSAGYPVIAVAVLLERSIFLGLIIPGDVILALGGVFAGRKELNLAGVIVIGTFAAITGESVGYWLGRRYGRALIKRLPIVGRLDKRFEDAERYFRKRGGLTVAIGRYATAAGSFTFQFGSTGFEPRTDARCGLAEVGVRERPFPALAHQLRQRWAWARCA